MKFKIDKEVFKLFPNLFVLIPVIHGFDNTKSTDKALKILRQTEKDVREKLTLDDVLGHQNVTEYTDAFKKFGIDPEVKLPAHLALIKRVLEGEEIPDINPMVNLYNAMSIKYLTPFGGEDLNQVYGDFVLKFAKGDEKWIAIGATKSKGPQKGELVWGDDFDLSTKALNWRQCERTKLTKSSVNGYFIMDGFENVNKKNIIKAADDFVEMALEYYGGKVEILSLDKNNSVAEIEFQSKDIKDYVPAEKKLVTKKVEVVKYLTPIEEKLELLLKDITKESDIKLEHPSDERFGDYSTNVAMQLASKLKKQPRVVAEEIKAKIASIDFVDKVEVAGAGFINFYLNKSYLAKEAEKINYDSEFDNQVSEYLKGKKMMVEFAHPNTHKELHIGHMRTLITGESLARILDISGAIVFRANYQGDIGPHVAKAIWGTRKLLAESGQTFDDWKDRSFGDKAHFLGKGYALGSAKYEDNKDEIDLINQYLYTKDKSVLSDYLLTREWSLGYYNQFYRRFGTNFDKLFFESEIADQGREIVDSLVGKLLEISEGAVVFDGEKYGLHKRVFKTAQGTPTYEGKELALAYAQKAEFEFDKNIHVVANEQAGYFQVVIKAIELMDNWFEGREYHLSMGMVTLVGRKMSSRTGDVVTVDSVLDEVKESIRPLIKTDNKTNDEIEEIAEKATIAAVKFSVLKSDPESNTVFDIKKSIDIDGDSGPYLLYTYARCKSVLAKTQIVEQKNIIKAPLVMSTEEESIVRELYKFGGKIVDSASRINPAVIAEYLLVVARKYNEFYAKNRIIGTEEEVWRIFLTKTTANVIHKGLRLLGIETIEKM